MSESDHNNENESEKEAESSQSNKDQSREKAKNHENHSDQAPLQDYSNGNSKSKSVNRDQLKRVAESETEKTASNHKKGGVTGSRKSLGDEMNQSSLSPNQEINLHSNKKTRKVLENDKILLSNRIVMLRKEEERLMKKIKGTKEKAEKIIEIKQRNEEKFNWKLEQEELEKLRVEQEREKLREDRERRRREFDMQQK